MRTKVGLLCFFVIIAGAVAAVSTQNQLVKKSNIGAKIADLPLADLDGKRHTLHDFRGSAVVVVFLSFECPVSNRYVPALNDIAKQYRRKKVAVVGICPSDEKAAALAKEANKFAVAFPVLYDPALHAARAFGAKRVPEAFLLDRQFTLRYRGRIDDGYSARLEKKTVTTRRDLQVALDEVLAGRKVNVAVTEPIGCPILFERRQVTSTKVTYYRDVLPILQRRCRSCHRPGEIAPFSLMTYRQAVTWADDIKSYTQSRKMPPWMPTRSVPFRGERKMTEAEINTVAAWVDNGMPPGDADDAPPRATFKKGWQLGKPDLILQPKDEITVAADGSDLFRCFAYQTNLKEDKFIVAYEVRPSNPGVVHHSVHFLDTQGRGRRLQERFQKRQKPGDRDFGPGYNFMMGPGFFPPSGDAGGWAPGIRPHFFPKNVGYYLPKGCDIVAQIHYHRTGRVEKDKTQIGLYFAKTDDCKPLQTFVVPGRFIFIPAGVRNHRVKGDIWAAQDCTVYTITPHMHLLGKSIEVTMTPPGGEPTLLIGIDDWDYDWQEIYHFEKPLRVKAGTRFHVEAIYDNSAENPNNPNVPPRRVHIGEQTTDEMCFVFMGATSDNGRHIGARLWQNGPIVRRIGVLPPRNKNK